ncbi:MAG: methyltransferase domain-containing protein [Candidatus Acidiferrales bacterium]
MSGARGSLDVFNSVLTRWNRSQQISPPPGTVKVNLGSYLLVEPGWLNVEGTIHAFLAKKTTALARLMYRFSKVGQLFDTESQYVKVLQNNTFIHHDLSYGLPFPDNSVDFIYSSHVLEHLYPSVAQNLLRDAHRALKRGGRIRVCIPDLKHAIDLYFDGQKAKALDYFFQGPEVGGFHRHKYMYDFEMLKSVLEQSAFVSVEKCSYRQGLMPDIEKLDNRPEETLFVEAAK